VNPLRSEINLVFMVDSLMCFCSSGVAACQPLLEPNNWETGENDWRYFVGRLAGIDEHFPQGMLESPTGVGT
jgi:hypothetical protein